MSSILDAEWLEMPPTRSYPRRWAFFVPLDLFAGEPGRCTVKIHQQHGYRSGNKIEEDTYRIENCGPVPGAMARQFLFENVGDESQDQPYLVTVGPHISQCTCKAGKCRTESCKHRSFASMILDLDLMPDWDAPGSDAEKCGQCFPDEAGG